MLNKEPAETDWSTFYTLLCESAEKWKPFEYSGVYKKNGMINSYNIVIEAGQKLIKNSENRVLSGDDINLLFGNDNKTDANGYSMLGHIGARSCGKKNLENATDEERENIFAALRKTMYAKTEREYLNAASEAFDALFKIEKIGIGTATRFLTLARPDRAISLNGASKTRIAKYTGLSESSLDKKNICLYLSVLKQIYQQAWYQASEPLDSKEKNIWHARTAFLDAFFYKKNLDLLPPMKK